MGRGLDIWIVYFMENPIKIGWFLFYGMMIWIGFLWNVWNQTCFLLEKHHGWDSWNPMTIL
jgi:hypothetical protein